MDILLGGTKRARVAYGFDDVAIVPGASNLDPGDVATTLTVRDQNYDIPILASAMDGVTDVRFCIEMGRLGGIGVLNLEGVQTRYEDPSEPLSRIAAADSETVTPLLQELYRPPIRDELVARRVREMRDGGIRPWVSATPANADRFLALAEEAGAAAFVVQSTVSTVRYRSSKFKALDLKALCKRSTIPVVVGNCVTYRVARDLMVAGASAVLVGVGPGAACTTRGVLGLGVPQITATADCASARDDFFRETGVYVPIVTDGGMHTGAHICKALVAGADAVMIGSPMASASEAPGGGWHWGMATPHAELPRGTRIRVGRRAPLKKLVLGPAERDDGTQNLVGAIRTLMGNVGAMTVQELHDAEFVYAPSFLSEGKSFQKDQKVGMGAGK